MACRGISFAFLPLLTGRLERVTVRTYGPYRKPEAKRQILVDVATTVVPSKVNMVGAQSGSLVAGDVALGDMSMSAYADPHVPVDPATTAVINFPLPHAPRILASRRSPSATGSRPSAVKEKTCELLSFNSRSRPARVSSIPTSMELEQADPSTRATIVRNLIS